MDGNSRRSSHSARPANLLSTLVPNRGPNRGSGRGPSVAVEDLLDDKLLLAAGRIQHADRTVPSLGGIPLLAKLGQGGMGAVYYGVHPRLNKEVAVKVLPFHLAEKQPELVQRFFREAEVAANIQSPHLVGVTDVNKECGLFYLVMEFVNGKSAGSYLRERKETSKTGLPEMTALEICIAATEGLAAAHSEGVIHRDIKPDNIMVPKARDGEQLEFKAAKLADLGLARSEEFSETITGSQQCMGTPGYMSPEQAMDAKSCGKPRRSASAAHRPSSGQAPGATPCSR